MIQPVTIKNSGSISLKEIPDLSYQEFSDAMIKLLTKNSSHCVNYFCSGNMSNRKLIACIADDETHEIQLLAHSLHPDENKLSSLSRLFPALQLFERDIFERFGLNFENHPWLKPVRFPSDSKYIPAGMDNYPFYTIEGEDLHEVGVGPVHAGIIEPGHFRFICNGETVLHLEIQLGYQHRGIENLMTSANSRLQQMILAENIAGDTVIGHSLTAANVFESLLGSNISNTLHLERLIALELERIAMHLADSATLCTDVAYQLGQVSCEALRTLVINGIQLWCGNRFGKGLIRPFGTNYPLSNEVSKNLLSILEDVKLRYSDITHRIFSLPSILDRFESIGKLTITQVQQIGAVGMVAKSSGLKRDVRWSHPSGHYSRFVFEPVILETGDVWARAMLRNLEIIQSISMISTILGKWETETNTKPDYSGNLPVNMLAISLVEGWRGEICHIGITDSNGELTHYSIKDPSFHNWTALALALRNQEISDFPLCNKSFNLSYCGHDL
jgi:Ni,Fe-hydrogenase III large subunit/NADH:ubiquinone oxidoreductase subunit C